MKIEYVIEKLYESSLNPQWTIVSTHPSFVTAEAAFAKIKHDLAMRNIFNDPNKSHVVKYRKRLIILSEEIDSRTIPGEKNIRGNYNWA